MAEQRDPKVSAAYLELGAEEPPRALDEAILAAARSSPASGRPSARPWTQRFAVPLGLAAVLVLSVTVTLRVQHEQPGIESPAVTQKEADAPEAPLRLKPEVQIKSAAEPARQRQAPRKEQTEPKPSAHQAPAAPSSASADMLASRADAGRLAESNIGGAAARQAEERTARDAEAAARAHQAGALLAKRPLDQQPAPALAAAAPAALATPAPAPQQPAKAAEQAARVPADTPEREFERIAQLRAEGRHDEADKAFLEFRRRYPGFRITEEMLRRVERR
jgi:resuscitation-promoting factor RpfA